jgi:hypothetical protein
MRRRWPSLTDCGATTAFTSRPRTFSINSPGNPCTLPASTNASTQPPGASACNSSRASGLLTECLKVLPARVECSPDGAPRNPGKNPGLTYSPSAWSLSCGFPDQSAKAFKAFGAH